MSQVQGTDSPEFLVCGACKAITDDWAHISMTPVQGDGEMSIIVCVWCLSILEKQLGVDFDKDKELLCTVDESGKIVPTPKDNN